MQKQNSLDRNECITCGEDTVIPHKRALRARGNSRNPSSEEFSGIPSLEFSQTKEFPIFHSPPIGKKIYQRRFFIVGRILWSFGGSWKLVSICVRKFLIFFPTIHYYHGSPKISLWFPRSRKSRALSNALQK